MGDTNYLLLIGIVLMVYGLNMVISGIFRVYNKTQGEEFLVAMVEQGTNLLIFGVGGIFAIFIRNMFIGKITFYLMIGVMIVYVILFLMDAARLLMVIFTTISLSFTKGYKGLCENGKLTDWLFLLSMVLESGAIGFVLLKMYQSIQ